MVGEGFIERSLNAYPGKISAIISEDNKHVVKEGLLENPMVTAIYITDDSSWNNYSDIANWAKTNNLSVGLGIYGNKFHEIGSAISSNSVDFVRVCMNVKKINDKSYTESLKKSLAKARANGLKYEVCIETDGSSKDVSLLGYIYKTFSPCENFVVQANKKMGLEEKERLMQATEDLNNVILRVWN